MGFCNGSGSLVIQAPGAKLEMERYDRVAEVIPLAENDKPSSGAATLRPQAIARTALVVVLVLLGAWTVRGFWPALAWAGIFGIALWPLYQHTQQRWPSGRHNVLLPALFTVAVALIFILPLVLALFEAAREAHDILQWIREIQASGLPVPDWVSHLPFGAQIGAWWHDNLATPAEQSEFLKRISHEWLPGLTREFGSQLVHRIVLFAFTVLTLFFVFRDGAALVRGLLVASDRLFGPQGERLGRQMIASVHGTVDGLVLVGLGEGAVLGVAYWIVGVPHPVLLGVLTAVAATIPFGAPVVFVLAALLLVAEGAVVAALIIISVGLLVLGVADHIIRPALIGGATQLPFVWVLFGILGGVETWGLLGLFLGPALMAALVLLWRELTASAS
jgi:predicted PurR-regulated permease PerM